MKREAESPRPRAPGGRTDGKSGSWTVTSESDGPQPFPVSSRAAWTLRALGREVQKTVTLKPGGGVVVTYELLTGDACELEVRPLVTRRSHHAVARTGDFQPVVTFDERSLTWRPREGEPATTIEF